MGIMAIDKAMVRPICGERLIDIKIVKDLMQMLGVKKQCLLAWTFVEEGRWIGLEKGINL